MRIVISGHDLPGRQFRDAGVPIHNVHVAVQIRSEPIGAVPGDAQSAEWRIDVSVVGEGGSFDFRGPAVHGSKGDRFLYLTWGDVSDASGYRMFRRAKLMFADIDPELIETATRSERALCAAVHLTDGHGGPRCARVRPPAISWSVGESSP